VITILVPRSRNRFVSVAVVVTATVAVGCAGAPRPDDGVEQSAQVVPEVTTQPPELIRSAGTVVSGPEPGCLLLDTGMRTYHLLGEAAADLAPGQEVTVTGMNDPNVTSCGDSTPLTITEVVPTE
jgi:hypothetical protein